MIEDFEEQLMCIHVLIRSRVWLLNIETELFTKPTHKRAIASGSAQEGATRPESYIPRVKAQANEVFVVVKAESDAKTKDIKAEEQEARDESQASVTATKKLDRIDKEWEDSMKRLAGVEDRGGQVPRCSRCCYCSPCRYKERVQKLKGWRCP